MGHEIEKYARQQEIDISCIIDNPSDWQKYNTELRNSDVAIEFTAPSVVVNNLKRLMDLGVPVTTGTTGWDEQLEQVENHCIKSNGSLFYASNFSIGVNLFFALNRYLTRLMADHNEYGISLEETHHTQKIDAPSGTAVSLVKDIIKEQDNYQTWKLMPGELQRGEIPVTAHRIEGVTGTHRVQFQSKIDTITIEHAAHSREGFAQGAIMAARWLTGKKGVFTMKDLLNI